MASGLQSLISLAVITLYAVNGWDPLVQLFYWLGTAGGFGVLVLLWLTALSMTSVLHPAVREHGVWAARIAPALASVLFTVALCWAVLNLDVLLGVPSDHPLTWVVPLVVAGTLALGAMWAAYLRANRPTTYAVIGMGPDAARSPRSASVGGGAA